MSNDGVDLPAQFEADLDRFELITKELFDDHYKAGLFIHGPFVEGHSKWFERYGPYNPHRYAFGVIDGEYGNKYIKCDLSNPTEGMYND